MVVGIFNLLQQNQLNPLSESIDKLDKAAPSTTPSASLASLNKSQDNQFGSLMGTLPTDKQVPG
jgi:hypothetical protein